MNTAHTTDSGRFLPLEIGAQLLSQAHPDAECELRHSSAFELLVATVLSAQTTDVRVNSVTETLFARWPSPEALAGAEEAEVADVVRPLGMGPRRAGQIVSLSRSLVANHGGDVPDNQKALEALAGVGRKTAHVVRGTWFGHSLLTVDTHVGRLARRFGWSAQTDPRKVEEDIVALAAHATHSGAERGDPPAAGQGGTGTEVGGSGFNLTELSHTMIFHGRRVCTARTPACGGCPLADVCPRIGVAA